MPKDNLLIALGQTIAARNALSSAQNYIMSDDELDKLAETALLAVATYRRALAIKAGV